MFIKPSREARIGFRTANGMSRAEAEADVDKGDSAACVFADQVFDKATKAGKVDAQGRIRIADAFDLMDEVIAEGEAE